MAHSPGTAAFVDSLTANLAEYRALYHTAAERGNRPAMHRLEVAIDGTIKLLALYGVSPN